MFSNLKPPQLTKQLEKISFSNSPVVAVVMSLYNHWEYTKDAFNSYFSSLDGRYNYILVLIDDCSNDQTETFILREMHHHDNIVYLRFKDNGGLTRLWNFGVHYALESLHAKYIFLANNDILIPSGAIGNLVDGLKNAKGQAIIGPLTNCPGLNQKTQDIRIFLPNYTPSHSLEDIESTYQKICTNPLKVVPEINGFFWGGYRDIFINNIFWSWADTVYYFNPFNRNFGNEREFQQRLRKKGGHALLAANTFIFHYKDVSMESAKSGRISPQWIYRSQEQKNFPSS